jgi:predicted nucleic acid-binding Zn ribbon protein
MRHGTGAIRQEKPCKECGTMFLPHNQRQIFCSHSCAKTASVRERREAAEARCCDVCGGTFAPATADQRFCSKPCRKKLENLHQRVKRGGARLVPFAFDQYFTLPINSARPAWLTPERFDELVAA